MTNGYILLPPDQNFPKDLTKELIENDLFVGYVEDYDDKLVKTDKVRMKISSCQDSKLISPEELEQRNTKFMEILNAWSRAEIQSHLDLMKDHYYSDFTILYRDSESA